MQFFASKVAGAKKIREYKQIFEDTTLEPFREDTKQ